MRKIPRTMSTQHPDNASIPFFSDGSILKGDDEIKEAYFAFSYLGAQEIMWDVEGKETDEFVIRKLITDYEEFFKKNVIGKDVFITVRVPNPIYEKAEAKLLIETLESIPRSYDTAKIFYGENSNPPIFEIILPMADLETMNRVYYYYKNIVSGKGKFKFCDTEPEITVKDWIGDFLPEKINLIPLFEDVKEMLNLRKTIKSFIKDKKNEIDHLRVFLARSDPAMTYSSIATVIAIKMALEEIYYIQEEEGIPIYPILGCGTAPFRGNFSPYTYQFIINNYPSVATFTIQSAFKYDFPIRDVQRAIENINITPVKAPEFLDSKDKLLEIIEKVSTEYKEQLLNIAPLVNELSIFVPRRRSRKIHVGLFGYSRQAEEGITLPRVISFCAVMYSIGIPPDILGLSALEKEDMKYVRSAFPRFDEKMSEILSLWNEEAMELLPPSIRSKIRETVNKFSFELNKEHLEISKEIIRRYSENKKDSKITDLIVSSGKIRNFLG